jgi:hypothetical protein
MSSVKECIKILSLNGIAHNEEEVNKIIELFKFWAKLEYQTYLKVKANGEESNIIYKGIN